MFQLRSSLRMMSLICGTQTQFSTRIVFILSKCLRMVAIALHAQQHLRFYQADVEGYQVVLQAFSQARFEQVHRVRVNSFKLGGSARPGPAAAPAQGNHPTSVVFLFVCHKTVCLAAEGRHGRISCSNGCGICCFVGRSNYISERRKHTHLLKLRLRLPDLRLLNGGESLLNLLLGGLPDGDLLGTFLLLTRPVEALDTDLLDALLRRLFGGLPDGDRLCLLESALLSPPLPLPVTFSLLTCPFSCTPFSPALVSSLACTAAFLSPLGSASGAARSAPVAGGAVTGIPCDAVPFGTSETSSCCSAPAAFAEVLPASAGFPCCFGVCLSGTEPLPFPDCTLSTFGVSLLAFLADAVPLDSFAVTFCGAGLFLRFQSADLLRLRVLLRLRSRDLHSKLDDLSTRFQRRRIFKGERMCWP